MTAVGTFRKCRNVQLESGMRTKADVPRPPGSTNRGYRSFNRYGHFTSGGIDDKIESTLPPVLRPKMVPRSYSRLNST
jgi:hypothetical protein